MRSLALLIAAAAAALPRAGAAAPGEWELLGELGAGVDGNPLRVTAPERAEPTPFLSASGRARGMLRDGRLRATATLAEALRLHPDAPGANALASRLEADARLALREGVSAGLAVAASDLSDADGLLARHALRGTASLSLGRSELGLALSGGWALFAPRDGRLSSLAARGPEAGLHGWWSPAPRHALALSGSVWSQDFPRWDPGRSDTTWSAAVAYTYRGPLHGALGYERSWNRSGVTGGDYERHRVTGRLAAWLPWDLVLAARLALQRSDYPAPLRLRDELLVSGGDEGQDLLELRVTHRFDEGWELTAAAAHYRSEAASQGGAPSFRRTVATVTLGWRARSEARD